jgi:PAS domain S-box-containing protein
MSDEIYRIMGLQPQESITPSDPFEHIHPDDRERLHQVRDAALRDHKHFGVEYRIVRPDGAVRYLHSEGDVICDEAGRPRRIFGITQDITERKRAEEALQLFRNLLDQSSDGIEIVDPATLRFLDCNESAHRSLGYSREAFLALSVWDIDPALDQERLARSYDEIEKSGAATFETLHRRKDGSVFPVEVNVKLVRLERDYRLAVVRDITERKRAEEALQESNAKLELILNTSPLPIQSADADGRITSWNKAAERLFGWTEEEVVGRVCPTVPPEDIEEYLGMIRRVMQGETYVGLVRYRRKKDGGLLTCSISAAPQQNGRRELAGVTFIVEDITERKRAEEALRESQQLLQLVLATLPVGVMVTDQAGNIVLANAASKRIWGDIIISGPQRWAQTKGFWHDSGERVAPTAWASVRALSEGRASLNELIDIETYGGQQKTIENSAAPIRNAKGLIVGAVVVNEDVTERVRAEEQLKRSNEELRALSARLHMVREEESARIAREIHDELGAALSSLKWDLEEIDEEIAEITGPAPFAPLRAKVGALILRTDGTVDTVRRIASELRPTALEEFGLAEALRWHAGQFQARTGIVVTCDCRLDKAALNHEKSTAIFRIVQEALTNVLRHAQATRVDIAIRHTGDHCVLTIRDNGRGITEAEKSGPRSLGLLGMRERAYLLSGEISIEGAEGRGTVITVRVPASG